MKMLKMLTALAVLALASMLSPAAFAAEHPALDVLATHATMTPMTVDSITTGDIVNGDVLATGSPGASGPERQRAPYEAAIAYLNLGPINAMMLSPSGGTVGDSCHASSLSGHADFDLHRRSPLLTG